jgi:hypothetical protein
VIELQMVRRMAFRGLLIAPFVIALLAAFGGVRYGVSAAAGLAMTVLNLWLSGRIIGGVAERNPELLLPAGLATFTLGLLLLTGIALGLRAADLVYFPVTGIVLVGSHLLLVLWEAAGAYDHADRSRAATAETRS